MAKSNIKSTRLLDASTATSAGGTYYDVQGYDLFHFVCKSVGVTTGATVLVEAKDLENNVVTVKSFSAGATANLTFPINGPYNQIRGRVSAYTDGTHTLRMDAIRRGGR